MQRPQLQMETTELASLPEPAVSAGYRLRPYQPGDEEVWCRLINEFIGGDYTPAKMAAELLDQPWFAPEDLCFAARGDEVAGTACALRQRDFDEGVGWLHMVVVDPAHRGKGLGRAVVLAVLHRFRQLGRAKVMLNTDDQRLPALRVYLSLGFKPRVFHESHPDRWQEIYQRLGLAQQEEKA